MYEKCEKAFLAGEPVPSLVIHVSKSDSDVLPSESWAYQDDDGRKQGGKSTATCPLEFQIVNKVAGRLYSVM